MLRRISLVTFDASNSSGAKGPRSGLGLAADDPSVVPDDVDQEFSTVQVALSQWALSIAEIGLPLQLCGMTPRAMYDQIAGMNSGYLNKTLALQVEQAPATQLARAKVRAAQKQLDRAELELGYTEIRSPIAAYGTHRTVNPDTRSRQGRVVTGLGRTPTAMLANKRIPSLPSRLRDAGAVSTDTSQSSIFTRPTTPRSATIDALETVFGAPWRVN